MELLRSASNCRCLVDPSAWKQLSEPSAAPSLPSAAHAGGEIGTTVDRWLGGLLKTSVVRNIQNAQTPLLPLGGSLEFANDDTTDKAD